MSNILDAILIELQEVKKLVSQPQQVSANASAEIINGEELCRRLDISEPTLIAWRKKKKIPSIKVGNVIRYNWPAVVEKLESE